MLGGNATWSGGTISGSGKLLVAAGASFNMSGTGAKSLSRRLSSQETLDAGSGTATLSNGAAMENASGGVMNWNNSYFQGGTGSGSISNAGILNLWSDKNMYVTTSPVAFTITGVLNKTGPGYVYFWGTVNHSGGMNIQEGRVEIGDGTSTRSLPRSGS